MEELLSVVVPVHDESDVLPLFVARLRPVLAGLRHEVLFVDDGSTDGSGALLEQLLADWPQARVLTLARNAGHQTALTAGLDHSAGDWVVSLDSDLQDPPELVPELLALARSSGADVVQAVHRDRASDSWLKRRTAGAYYRVVERLTGVPVVPHAGDYRLLSREVVLALRALPERQRVYRLLVPALGFRTETVEHRRDPRAAGSSSYSVPRMTLLASDSVVSFSTTPLRIATGIGLTSALVAALLALWVLGVKVTGNAVPGWASSTLGVLFLGAVQLLCLGVLGEYVGRIYDEVRRRPSYRLRGHSPCEHCGR